MNIYTVISLAVGIINKRILDKKKLFFFKNSFLIKIYENPLENPLKWKTKHEGKNICYKDNVIFFVASKFLQ